jgi:hypothetical protein
MHHLFEQINPAEAPQTQPLACIDLHPFQVYLEQHQLPWSTVARAAEVPCLIVWNIAHGIQVRGAQAARVRVAVHRLTEVAYTGPMNISDEGQTHEPQTVAMQATAGEAPR